MSSIRVRFPPSPTGYCHVGTARMALLNYLFARKNSGTIVFRSEDTDRERSTKEFEDDIIDSIHWLGLSWDEFYRQSERTPVYTAAIEKLLESNRAYISKEESKKNAGEIVEVVRLRNPGESVTFTDLVRGDITFDTTELGDFVIARGVQDPLYHLAVVVDDEEHHITHVIRGEEHISNTPRQILIQEALGYDRPQYAHYPLFLSADRAKLSKRKGDVAVKEYRAQGFLPEALLNFIGTLGWTPPSGKEILSLEEMVEQFDLSDLHKSGAVFDMEKLRWFNREYLLKLPDLDFETQSCAILKTSIESKGLEWNSDMGRTLVPLLRERVHVWSDIEGMVQEGEFDFFFTDPLHSSADIAGKGSDAATARTHLLRISEMLSQTSDEIFSSPERLKDVIWDYATQEGRGAVLWPMRYALSGRAKSPDPFIIASALGKERSISRLRAAAEIIV